MPTTEATRKNITKRFEKIPIIYKLDNFGVWWLSHAPNRLDRALCYVQISVIKCNTIVYIIYERIQIMWL